MRLNLPFGSSPTLRPASSSSLSAKGAPYYQSKWFHVSKNESKERPILYTNITIHTLMKKLLLCSVKVVSCRCCIASINMLVWRECITLCTLDGNVWKWGKAIKETLHFSSLGLKYLASISISSGVSFFLKAGVSAAGSSCSFFPRGMNCSIENLTCWTSGL